MLPALQGGDLAHRLAEVLLGAVLTLEPRLELAVEHVVHERRFPRPRDARHRGQRAERNAHVDAGEVVEPRAFDVEPAYRRPARGWYADAFFAREVLARERSGFAHSGGRPLIDELAAGCAARRPELHPPVRGAHRSGIMPHHNHRVP